LAFNSCNNGYGGLAYVSIYFAEDDFVITDAASAQTALDAWSAVEVGGATMDLIYYKLDAFAYDDIEDKYDFFDATESIVDLITVKNRSDLDFTTMMMANETGYEIPAIFVETDGEESGTVCTGSAADGDTYTSTFHGYYYDGQFYNDFHDQDNGGAGFIFDTSVQGDPVIAAMDVDTNISCGVLDYTQVGESGMNLHLVLVRGVMENDFYFPIYFSADEIQGEDDAEIASAIQTYLDGASSSWGFSSMTVVYAKKDAFEYSGEPNVEGTAYTLKDAEIVADGVTYLMGLSSGGTAYSDPAINITLGTSGEPVPEFKDYLLIVTIALALGLAYKVIPKTQLTKA